MIGRNELCPCGSGRKYKKCCLQKNNLVEFARNRVLYAKGLYKNIENKIDEYSKSLNLYNYEDDCAKKFYTSKDTNSIIDKQYNTYFLYDYKNNNGKKIINMFIDDNKLTLNKINQNILSSILKSNISIFKIEEIGPTKLIIRDYFSDKKIIIEDIDIFKNLEVGENIIARPVNIQGINILIDDYIKVSDKDLHIIIDNINKMYGKCNEGIKNLSEFIINNSDLIYKFGQQILLNDNLYVINTLNTDVKEIINNKGNNKLDENIYDALKNNIEEKYLQKGLDLWKAFIKSNKSIKGSENGWAAAIEYYIKKDAGEVITQVQISEKYDISPRTLGKRYKELKAS